MDYGEYISKVCKGELFKASINEIENYVSNITNKRGEEEGEKESFCLLQFFRDSNKVHLYEVKNEECRGTLRWWVEEINLNLKHDFNEDINKCNDWFGNKNGIVEIDSQFKTPEQIAINDKLKRWVSGLGLAESCKKIYIKGQYSNALALKYAFQNEGKVVKEVPNGKPGKLDINFPELMAKAVNLYDEQMTLHQYRNLKTYIPIDDNTLNSPFFKNAEKICILTWRDILPVTTSTTDDIAIPIATSEYKFKLISIEGYKVDLFRNIFIKTKDHISGKTKVVHVYDPFKARYEVCSFESSSEIEECNATRQIEFTNRQLSVGNGKNKDKCMSFEDIYGEYFINAKRVYVEAVYLDKTHQRRNLGELINTITSKNTVKVIKVGFKPGDDQSSSKIEEEMNKIKKDLAKRNIVFEWKSNMREGHSRHMYIDYEGHNSIIQATMDYGVDIYEMPQERSVLGYTAKKVNKSMNITFTWFDDTLESYKTAWS